MFRLRGCQEICGYGGAMLLGDTVWNISYRVAVDAQGQEFATEVAREAVRAADRVRPELPAVAYLLEHDRASKRVAEKLEMTLVFRGADAGNPDQDAVRLVYASRPLTPRELEVLKR